MKPEFFATLRNTSLNVPRKVQHIETGEVGWAARYGRPSWGGVRISVFKDRKDAQDADVSDDVGDKVVERCVTALSLWKVVK